MTDLEITRLCAEALQVENKYPWNPLHDDAQAMALVKKFILIVCPITLDGKFEGWSVFKDWPNEKEYADLNRAICECVAKMQAQKEPE